MFIKSTLFTDRPLLFVLLALIHCVPRFCLSVPKLQPTVFVIITKTYSSAWSSRLLVLTTNLLMTVKKSGSKMQVPKRTNVIMNHNSSKFKNFFLIYLIKIGRILITNWSIFVNFRSIFMVFLIFFCSIRYFVFFFKFNFLK